MSCFAGRFFASEPLEKHELCSDIVKGVSLRLADSQVPGDDILTMISLLFLAMVLCG